MCWAQGLTEPHRTRSCPSGSGWARGRKQAVERAPSALLCPYGLRYTDPPGSQLSRQPFQTESPDRPLPSSAPVAPQPTLTGSVQASLQLNPQRHSHLPARGPAAVCSDGAAGRLFGVSAPSFSSGTAPCTPGGEQGEDSAAQPPDFGLLTCKRGAGALNSKERAEGAKSGRHSGQLPCCRHCQPLGASWRKGHLGQQRGSGKAWRKAQEGRGQGLAGLELRGGGQPLESQNGQQGPRRGERDLPSGGRSRVPPGAGLGLGQVWCQGWLSAGPLFGISSLNLSLKGSLHTAAQLRRRPER